MATATIRIWEGASGSKTKNLWGSQSIANINSIIKNSLPKYYKITAATLRVYANFDGAGGLANVYMKYGFSNSTNSISRQLGGEFKLTKNDVAYSVDVTGYIGKYKEVITTYGSNFVANVYTSNVVVGSSGALHISYAELYVTYEVNPITINGVASPSEGGTVTGGGTFEMYSTVTLTAIPNKGYKFVKWMQSGASITSNPLTTEITANATYTAYFEKLPPPEFTSASMTYLNKQISADNKVIHNEGFIISVGVK
jgi:hypothetical protein